MFEIKPTHVTQFVADFPLIQAIKCLVRTILYPIGSLLVASFVGKFNIFPPSWRCIIYCYDKIQSYCSHVSSNSCYSLFETTWPKITTLSASAMLGDNQTVKVAAIQSTLDENMQFSDYFVGLLRWPSKFKIWEKVSVRGFNTYSLKSSDYKENVELIIMRVI